MLSRQQHLYEPFINKRRCDVMMTFADAPLPCSQRPRYVALLPMIIRLAIYRTIFYVRSTVTGKLLEEMRCLFTTGSDVLSKRSKILSRKHEKYETTFKRSATCALAYGIVNWNSSSTIFLVLEPCVVHPLLTLVELSIVHEFNEVPQILEKLKTMNSLTGK